MKQDAKKGDSESLGTTIDRRRFVELTGIGIASGLAGCSGGSSNGQGTQGGTDNTGDDGTDNTGDDGTTETATEAPRAGGHLRVRVPKGISTISPIHTDSLYSQYLPIRMLYSQLSWLDYDNERRDDLAESWEHNDALDQWVVGIRDDATFNHDGSPVRAEDIVATHRTIREGNFPGKGSLGGISAVEEVDETTVQFNLKNPNADFPVFQARAWSSIVPKSVAEKKRKKLNTGNFGSGPFVLDSYPSQTEVVMTKNPDYYRTDEDGIQLPYVDKLTIKTVEENATAITQIQNKSTDIDRLTSLSQVDRVKNIDNLKTSVAPGGRLVAFVMDTNHEPWDDNRVRKAMKLGIDRDAFVQNAINGKGVKGNDTHIGPAYRYHADLPQRTQDIDRAKQLLADAGYPDGFHLTEDFDITLYTPGQPQH